MACNIRNSLQIVQTTQSSGIFDLQKESDSQFAQKATYRKMSSLEAARLDYLHFSDLLEEKRVFDE